MRARSSRRSALVTGVAVLVVALAGCGQGEEPAAEPETSTSATSTTTTATGPELAQSCEAERYRVRYPEGWSTNAGDVVPACRFFDPRPFTVPPATEFLGAAVILDVESIPYSRLTEAAGTGEEVLDRQETTVAGRPAQRIETRATEPALLPSGVPSLRYLVDLDGSTLVASTHGLPGFDHDRNREVLDAMMRSLEVRDDGCSAAGLPSQPEPQDLPAPVAEMRASIVAAATACDYARLAQLARQGRFTYSFGEEADPAAFWRRAERSGDPLAVLVRLLDRPFATRTVEGATQFLWPRAYVHERWDDVPPEAREELRPMYGQEDFERFSRSGSYTGYRVGITGEGDWIFFVAGD